MHTIFLTWRLKWKPSWSKLLNPQGDNRLYFALTLVLKLLCDILITSMHYRYLFDNKPLYINLLHNIIVMFYVEI